MAWHHGEWCTSAAQAYQNVEMVVLVDRIDSTRPQMPTPITASASASSARRYQASGVQRRRRAGTTGGPVVVCKQRCERGPSVQRRKPYHCAIVQHT